MTRFRRPLTAPRLLCLSALREDFAIVRAGSPPARQHPSGHHRLDPAAGEGRGPLPPPRRSGSGVWASRGRRPHAPGTLRLSGCSSSGCCSPGRPRGRPHSFGPAPAGLRPHSAWSHTPSRPAGGQRVGLRSPRGVPAPRGLTCRSPEISAPPGPPSPPRPRSPGPGAQRAPAQPELAAGPPHAQVPAGPVCGRDARAAASAFLLPAGRRAGSGSPGPRRAREWSLVAAAAVRSGAERSWRRKSSFAYL